MGLCPSFYQRKRPPPLEFPLLNHSDFQISNCEYYNDGDELINSMSINSPICEGSLEFNKENEQMCFLTTQENQKKINHVLDTKINRLQQNTQDNFRVISKDIHSMYQELQDYKSNHQASSK